MAEVVQDMSEQRAETPRATAPAAPGIQYDQTAYPDSATLSPAERLILWIVRSLAEDPGNWSLIQRELWLRCGPARIEAVLQSLHEMLTTLVLHRRRVLSVRKPTSPRVSADEVTMLSLIAAAQAQQACKLDALARWLVRQQGHDLLMTQATEFARGLLAAGIALTQTASADSE